MSTTFHTSFMFPQLHCLLVVGSLGVGRFKEPCPPSILNLHNIILRPRSLAVRIDNKLSIAPRWALDTVSLVTLGRVRTLLKDRKPK
jgi:hypothetical protein